MVKDFKTVLLCLCLVCFKCVSLKDKNQFKKQIPSNSVLTFMKKYGYLVDDGGQSEALYTEERISEKIKLLQRYGGIKETGVIDSRTLKLIASPRCGVPDIIQRKRRKRYAVVNGWNRRNLTYYIANWSPKLGEAVVARNIQKALDIWAGYGRLSFSRAYDQNADIIVAFARGYHGDQYPFDGPGNILAHAFFPYDYEGPSTGGDIHFDDDENWSDVSSGVGDKDFGTDFFAVALHELGHSLGLAHSTVPTSVMFPYYKGIESDSQSPLDYDDILGMYKLYISRRIKGDENVPPQYPSSELPKSSTTRRPKPTTSRHRHRETEETTPHTRNTRPSTRRTTHKSRHSSTTEKNHRHSTVSYEGDTESVDEHINHNPKHKGPKNHSPSLPYICHGHFDAVATLRNELFIFKDEYIWRLKEKGRIEPNYPVPIQQMFPELPKHIKKVNAAYQRPDGSIVLFTGNKLWIYDGSRFVENSPQPLSYYGLPGYLQNIDAVQTWGRNGKTYFYAKDRFWRYNETAKSMDPGYPMHMDRWRGVPENLDAATTWKDGITYFFKGELFWKFDDNWVTTTEESPFPVAPIWLGCKEDEVRMRNMYGF